MGNSLSMSGCLPHSSPSHGARNTTPSGKADTEWCMSTSLPQQRDMADRVYRHDWGGLFGRLLFFLKYSGITLFLLQSIRHVNLLS